METGDVRAAFEAALSPALKTIYKVAFGYTRNRDDAEDLVQEAALRAFRAFDSYERGTNFKAWFIRIMTNLHINRQRSSARDRAAVELDDVPDLYLYQQSSKARLGGKETDPAGLIVAKLDSESIQDAIAGLSDEFRSVATLYFVDEFSYQEIADMLGIPVGTVRSRLHRARRRLQARLWELAKENGVVNGTKPKGA